MKTARVKDFSLILTGLLTQYDQKESLREMRRGGRANIYRLGHYLKAAQDADRAAKAVGIWNRDDITAISAYQELLAQRFIFEGARGKKEFALAPVRQLERQMKAWVEQGKSCRSTARRGGTTPLGRGYLDELQGILHLE